MFKSSVSASSVTKHCLQASSLRFGYKVVVVDTPGIFDTSQTNAKVQEEICKCIAITCPGPHAFILVLSISRFTEEEQNSIEHCIKYFGENIYKYAIILFSCKDNLDLEKTSLYEYLKTAPARLRELIQNCGGRVYAFNNRLEGQERYEQARQLLDSISKNDGTFYTNEMYQEADEILKKQEIEMKRKTKEEYDRKWQEIEQQIGKKYEGKMAEKNKEIQNSNDRLECLKKEKISDEYEKKLLQEKIKYFENKQKESEGKEKEEFQNRLHQLRGNLAEAEVVARRRETEMDAIREKNRTIIEDHKKIEEQHTAELRYLETRLKEEFNKELNSIRDELRKKIEEDKSFWKILSKLFNLIGEKIRNLFRSDT